MKKQPLISICLLNYNGERYLNKVISGIISLKYSHKEIIILDNKSKDNSLKILEEYKGIKVIKNSINEGYGEGKNKLVDIAKGKYILLLDNDILIKDFNLLNKILNFYLSEKNLAFISFPLIDINKTKTDHYGLFYSTRKRLVNFEKIKELKPFTIGGFIGGAVFFERNLFSKLGSYDIKYPFNLDDYDLSARSWISGLKIKLYSKTGAIHLGISTRENPDSWSWKNQYYLSGFGRMILKNYSLKNVIFWLPLSIVWIFFKSIKKAFKFRSKKPLLSLILSVCFFIRDLPDTLKQRKIIQSKRIIKEDIFLKIKPP